MYAGCSPVNVEDGGTEWTLPCSKLSIENRPSACQVRRQQNAPVGANMPADVGRVKHRPVDKDHLGLRRRKGRTRRDALSARATIHGPGVRRFALLAHRTSGIGMSRHDHRGGDEECTSRYHGQSPCENGPTLSRWVRIFTRNRRSITPRNLTRLAAPQLRGDGTATLPIHNRPSTGRLKCITISKS
jgi:hypothetical protein